MEEMKDMAEEVSRKEKSLIAIVVVILLVVLAMALVGFLMIKPGDDTIQGQCEATEIRISGKLTGRVSELYVSEGMQVKAGDTLVYIHSSIMDAKKDQATAMQDAASATNRKVDAGTRRQIINSAYDLWQQALSAKIITEKTYNRMERLYTQGVVSEQKRDEAKAAFDVAVAGEQAAKSQYDMAVEGAQKEDKQAAAAMVEAAKGSVKEVDAFMEDSYLLSPFDGEITEIYPNESELVSAGAPIMTLQKEERWAVFNVRENLLKDIKQGSMLKVYIPALDITTEMEVFYIKDMGEYANWQATKATGDYDSRTFQIKARPKEKLDNFLPGMSVVLKDY